jgi:hypothetical protein
MFGDLAHGQSITPGIGQSHHWYAVSDVIMKIDGKRRVSVIRMEPGIRRIKVYTNGEFENVAGEIAFVYNLEINCLAYIFTLLIGSLIFRGFRFMIPGDAISRPNIVPIGATSSR